MSEIGKRINAVIAHRLAPCLKEAGFRRKGRTFHRVADERTDVVNVQGSKWNAGRTGEFTINVGVYYPQIAELYDEYRPDGLPEEYHCTLRSRIRWPERRHSEFQTRRALERLSRAEVRALQTNSRDS